MYWRYIECIRDISMDILEKNMVDLKLIKIHENIRKTF